MSQRHIAVPRPKLGFSMPHKQRLLQLHDTLTLNAAVMVRTRMRSPFMGCHEVEKVWPRPILRTLEPGEHTAFARRFGQLAVTLPI